MMIDSSSFFALYRYFLLVVVAASSSPCMLSEELLVFASSSRGVFIQGVGVVGCDDLHKHETSTRVRQTALKTDKLNKLSSQSTHTMFLLFITQIDSSRPRQICTHKILGKLDTTIRIPRPDITRNIYDGRRRV